MAKEVKKNDFDDDPVVPASYTIIPAMVAVWHVERKPKMTARRGKSGKKGKEERQHAKSRARKRREERGLTG